MKLAEARDLVREFEVLSSWLEEQKKPHGIEIHERFLTPLVEKRLKDLQAIFEPPAPEQPAAPPKAKRGEVLEAVSAYLEGYLSDGGEVTAALVSKNLGLNQGSVGDALRSLAADGVIERSGRGIFIVRGTKPQFTEADPYPSPEEMGVSLDGEG